MKISTTDVFRALWRLAIYFLKYGDLNPNIWDPFHRSSRVGSVEGLVFLAASDVFHFGLPGLIEELHKDKP